MLFTPVSAKTGIRLKMNIKKTEIPRGRITTFNVVDKKGKEYKCKTKACSLPRCICDALIYD
jgi:hypothetical protein